MLRSFLDSQSKHFEGRGKLRMFFPLWEALDTLLYSPGKVTQKTLHVRDGLNLKRMMIVVVIGVIPTVFMAMYNVGRQAHEAILAGAAPLGVWQTRAFEAMGYSFENALVPNFIHGALYFLPIFITSLSG